MLLDAAKRLARDDFDFRIVLVGDGELRAEIEDQIRSAGLGDRVEIAGWQDSKGVKKALARTRALVLASFGEGLPVVIMEAMAMGRPVVSSNVGGISELVLEGETGWLAPAGDSKRLAEAMRQALETPDEKLTEMGQRARHRMLQRHDVHCETSKLRRLFALYYGPDRPIRGPSSGEEVGSD